MPPITVEKEPWSDIYYVVKINGRIVRWGLTLEQATEARNNFIAQGRQA